VDDVVGPTLEAKKRVHHSDLDAFRDGDWNCRTVKLFVVRNSADDLQEIDQTLATR